MKNNKVSQENNSAYPQLMRVYIRLRSTQVCESQSGLVVTDSPNPRIVHPFPPLAITPKPTNNNDNHHCKRSTRQRTRPTIVSGRVHRSPANIAASPRLYGGRRQVSGVRITVSSGRRARWLRCSAFSRVSARAALYEGALPRVVRGVVCLVVQLPPAGSCGVALRSYRCCRGGRRGFFGCHMTPCGVMWHVIRGK